MISTTYSNTRIVLWVDLEIEGKESATLEKDLFLFIYYYWLDWKRTYLQEKRAKRAETSSWGLLKPMQGSIWDYTWLGEFDQ